MNRIECPGLDGSNPLHFLASLGVLQIGSVSGFIQSMSWKKGSQWVPVFQVHPDLSFDSFCSKLCDAFVSAKLSRFREQFDECILKHAELENDITSLENEKILVKTKDDKSSVNMRLNEKKTIRKRVKARIKRMEPLLEPKFSDAKPKSYALRQIFDRYPIASQALHLDDISKGGLTKAQLRATFMQFSESPSFLKPSGLAADLHLHEKRAGKQVDLIARSHFSFSNNNSGKQLLKDFASSASLCTPSRFRDALATDGTMQDPITGLGWDPSSQKAYALQFNNPQDEVFSSISINVLAVIGLSSFPVCPGAIGRMTTGFSQIQDNAQSALSSEESDDSDEEEKREFGRIREYFSWPVWESSISEQVVLSLLSHAEIQMREPNPMRLSRQGIAAVYRSRRISVNKRSFFAPSRSL